MSLVVVVDLTGFRQVRDGRRRRMWVVDDVADREERRLLSAEPIWVAVVVVVGVSTAGDAVVTIPGHAAVCVPSSVASCFEISLSSLDGRDNDRRFRKPPWPPPVPCATDRPPVSDTVVRYDVSARREPFSAVLPSFLPSARVQSPWPLFLPVAK